MPHSLRTAAPFGIGLRHGVCVKPPTVTRDSAAFGNRLICFAPLTMVATSSGCRAGDERSPAYHQDQHCAGGSRRGSSFRAFGVDSDAWQMMRLHLTGS